jgi:dUTP pyrophosphatase
MKVKIKKLHPDAVIPKYQTKDSSGFDLHALEEVIIFPGSTKLVRTGLAVAVQEGHELQIRPRSGLSLKSGLRIANSPGTVDPDYRGEVCIIIENTAKTIPDSVGYPYEIKKGERIAQGVICPIVQAEFEEVEELEETERGQNGFGSTGA